MQIATSSKRPEVFVEKEEEEVRRRSSVSPDAMRLASQHRRYSLMSEQGRGSFSEKKSVDDENGNHKENV